MTGNRVATCVQVELIGHENDKGTPHLPVGRTDLDVVSDWERPRLARYSQ